LKIHAKISPSGPEAPKRTFTTTDNSTASRSLGLNGVPPRLERSPGSRVSEAALIYVVDDLPCLVELYAVVLEADGHRVRTFGDRNTALAALKTDEEKPALLITDYRNSSMPTDHFLRDCRALHPSLRILMATGFDHQGAQPAGVVPNGFLQKPFTFEELRDEVRGLVAESLMARASHS
jgi:DNA-binding NtrC family response regulator